MTERNDDNKDWRPRPDPTERTTEDLLREVEGVRRAMQSLRELLEAKLSNNKEINIEKLNSVDTQFALIERQRVEQKADTTAAVAAALAAAKEAVNEQTIASQARTDKSEISMEKRVDQQALTTDVAIKGINEKVDDLKDRDLADLRARVGSLETMKQSGTENRDRTGQIVMMTITAASVIVAITLGIINLAT
jgi:hypothetical protein